jgi:hypothetical protein
MGEAQFTWAKRATESFRRARFRTAALEFRVSLLLDPSSSHQMVMFARSLEHVNPHSPFRHYARKATVLSPGDATGWAVWARGAFKQHELSHALNAIKRHTILGPAAPGAVLLMSRVHFQRGEATLALRYLGWAATVVPTDKNVKIAQARCLFRLAQYAAALRTGDAAFLHGASPEEYGFDHCRIARAAGRLDIAEPLLAELSSKDESIARRRQALELTVTVDDLRAKRP